MILDCNTCSASVNAEEVGHIDQAHSDDWMENIRYTLLKCPRCSSPILTKQEIEHVIDYTFDWGLPKSIFPVTEFHINPIIPEKLGKALIECVQCYRAKSYTAAAIMSRRALEGFCSIKGAEEGNLDKSIKKLKDQGIINEQLYEWANQLRLVGNEAAHNINSEFSALDAKDMLDFTIAIFDFTYSFKDKFDKFKERIAKAK